MNIKKTNRKKTATMLVISVLATLSLGGCAQQQYIDNPELKKSIVILIQKVERLESLHGIQKTTPAISTQRKISPAASNKTLKLDIPSYAKKSKRTTIVDYLPSSGKIKFKNCDKFGWCETEGFKGYVQKWRFSR